MDRHLEKEQQLVFVREKALRGRDTRNKEEHPGMSRSSLEDSGKKLAQRRRKRNILTVVRF